MIGWPGHKEDDGDNEIDRAPIHERQRRITACVHTHESDEPHRCERPARQHRPRRAVSQVPSEPDEGEYGTRDKRGGIDTDDIPRIAHNNGHERHEQHKTPRPSPRIGSEQDGQL